MSDIKACPFCGGRGQTYRDDDGPDERPSAYYVECYNCKASTYPTKEYSFEAIDEWNIRVKTDE